MLDKYDKVPGDAIVREHFGFTAAEDAGVCTHTVAGVWQAMWRKLGHCPNYEGDGELPTSEFAMKIGQWQKEDKLVVGIYNTLKAGQTNWYFKWFCTNYQLFRRRNVKELVYLKAWKQAGMPALIK